MSSPHRQTKADVVAEFRRTQILDAARDRFTRQGVADTTVDHIARAARMAKGTVYLYYRSKDEILRQLVAQDLAELRDGTLPAIRAEGDIETRLQRYLTTTLGFFEQKRDFMEHCQIELSPDIRRKVRATLGELYRAQVDAWHAVLAEAAAGGAIAGHAVDEAATIVALARGLALQRLGGCASDPIEVEATRASQLLWKGLATR
jgi:AcrR family transcriptional regulator